MLQIVYFSEEGVPWTMEQRKYVWECQSFLDYASTSWIRIQAEVVMMITMEVCSCWQKNYYIVCHEIFLYHALLMTLINTLPHDATWIMEWASNDLLVHSSTDNKPDPARVSLLLWASVWFMLVSSWHTVRDWEGMHYPTLICNLNTIS